MLKALAPARRFAAVALTAILAVSGTVLASPAAYAAGSDDRIGRLADADYSDVPFLGSLKLPTASGSLTDAEWVNAGPITSEASCPAKTQATVTRIVLGDGYIHHYPVATQRLTPIPGSGMDGNPIRLSVDMPAEDGEQYALFSVGMAWNEEIPAGPFWFVVTCEPNADYATASKLDAPYFAIKLNSDGTNWSVPDTGTGPALKATQTTMNASASRIDGKVDFAATVLANNTNVTGGSVEFVDADSGAVLALATVIAGKAAALSITPIDAVTPLSVKAVYKPAEGFLTSESAAHKVTGVRIPGSTTGTGDVTVTVPDGPAPAGSVKFTAAATANLGDAKLTATGIEASGSIEGAVVTDSRADKSAAWTVNGKASSFTTTATTSGTRLTEIPASALAWTPAARPNSTLPSGASPGTANAKLDATQPLVSWAGGAPTPGELISQVGAALTLTAVGDFAPGKYTAKLTLTLI